MNGSIETSETKHESFELRREQFFVDFKKITSEVKRLRNQLHPYDFTRIYKKKRTEMNELYPEFKQITETIFGINSFIRSHENFNYYRESLVREQQIKELINLAQWQHRATEVLISFGWDKSLSEKFWQQVEDFYQIFSNYPTDFEGYKRGVIGQARAFLILKELGYNPQLATPKEDVLEGTDFYIFLPDQNKKLRTQIKLSSQKGESVVEVVDCGLPSVVVDSEEKQTRFQADTATELAQIREKCGTLSQRLGKMVQSLVIILNENDFDVDGRPRPVLIEKLKKSIREKIK